MMALRMLASRFTLSAPINAEDADDDYYFHFALRQRR